MAHFAVSAVGRDRPGIVSAIAEGLLELEGKLAFCNLTPTIQKTFHIMGLTQFATIYEDEAAAVGEMTG